MQSYHIRYQKCNNNHSFYRYGKDSNGYQKYLCRNRCHKFAPKRPRPEGQIVGRNFRRTYNYRERISSAAAITSKSGHNLLRSMATFGTQPPTALDTLQIRVSSPSFGYFDTVFITSASILPATAMPSFFISYIQPLKDLQVLLSKRACPVMSE